VSLFVVVVFCPKGEKERAKRERRAKNLHAKSRKREEK